MAGLPMPIPYTWNVGDVATASLLNAQIRDTANFLLALPGCAIRQTASQTLSSTVWAPIAMDTTDYDPWGGHSNTTNNSRFTCQIAARYVILGALSMASSTAGAIRAATIALNGSRNSIWGSGPGIGGGNFTNLLCARTAYLNVGDYVELHGMQDSGGNLSTTPSANFQAWMQVYMTANQ